MHAITGPEVTTFVANNQAPEEISLEANYHWVGIKRRKKAYWLEHRRPTSRMESLRLLWGSAATRLAVIATAAPTVRHASESGSLLLTAGAIVSSGAAVFGSGRFMERQGLKRSHSITDRFNAQFNTMLQTGVEIPNNVSHRFAGMATYSLAPHDLYFDCLAQVLPAYAEAHTTLSGLAQEMTRRRQVAELSGQTSEESGKPVTRSRRRKRVQPQESSDELVVLHSQYKDYAGQLLYSANAYSDQLNNHVRTVELAKQVSEQRADMIKAFLGHSFSSALVEAVYQATNVPIAKELARPNDPREASDSAHIIAVLNKMANTNPSFDELHRMYTYQAGVLSLPPWEAIEQKVMEATTYTSASRLRT